MSGATADEMKIVSEKVEQLKKLEGGVRIGGKGTVRRKKKIVVHRGGGNSADEKRLQSMCKKINCTELSSVDETNMFLDDGTVLHFTNPKVQVSLPSNMAAVTGTGELVRLMDMLPDVLHQVGPEQVKCLRSPQAIGNNRSPTANHALRRRRRNSNLPPSHNVEPSVESSHDGDDEGVSTSTEGVSTSTEGVSTLTENVAGINLGDIK